MTAEFELSVEQLFQVGLDVASIYRRALVKLPFVGFTLPSFVFSCAPVTISVVQHNNGSDTYTHFLQFRLLVQGS